MKKLISCLTGAFFLGPLAAVAEGIPMDEDHWDFRGTGDFVEYLGRPAIHLNNGLATVKDRKFQNGIIEFDIAFSEARGFMGLYFRVREEGTSYEDIYFRSHQGGNPDPNQYTPAFHRLTAWQIYYGPQYSTPMEYTFDAWQHVKVLVNGDAAEFYLDSEEPFLHVDDLLNENDPGAVSLSSFFNEAYFSNFEMTETDDVAFRGEAVPFEPWPENLVESFEVAKGAIPAAEVSPDKPLDPNVLEDITWQVLPVERNGIANLARINGISDEAATTLVRIRVKSDSEQIKVLKFGYSDKASVFLNGTPIAGGDNTYQSRDYRYLGTVGLFDEVYLDLKEGENEVIFTITEAFGGWAVMAAFEDMEGITLIR